LAQTNKITFSSAGDALEEKFQRLYLYQLVNQGYGSLVQKQASQNSVLVCNYDIILHVSEILPLVKLCDSQLLWLKFYY